MSYFSALGKDGLLLEDNVESKAGEAVRAAIVYLAFSLKR